MSIIQPKLGALVAALGIAVLSVACSPQAPAPATESSAVGSPGQKVSSKPVSALKGLTIVAFGPSETAAGEPFNSQPDGSSAIWAKADRNIEGYDVALWLNDKRLANPGISGDVVTGTLPPGESLSAGESKLEIRVGPDGTALSSDAAIIKVK